MCAKKKKDCYLGVEGFETWMDQFFSDPYASFHYPNGIRIDLFETELEYILEADLPTVCQKQVHIQKTKEGLRILILKDPKCILKRDIHLPVNVMYKKMSARFENGLLEIHISKNETVPAGGSSVHFTD
ncbi:MAG: Hsp20/alpha crystallin family protein [Ectobacillus sp.]